MTFDNFLFLVLAGQDGIYRNSGLETGVTLKDAVTNPQYDA